MKRHFFERNILIINELKRYAPPDDKLLSIAPHCNIADPFFKFIRILEQNIKVNYFLIGSNLLSFLQSVNGSLSRLYAAHQYIIENHEKSKRPNLSQLEIDFEILKDSSILQEYSYTLREFILMLRIAVDQLILLLTVNSTKNKNSCDSIGGFLKKMNEHQEKYKKYDKKFLVGLNAAANYLKHHPYQLENPSQIIHLLTPSLLVGAYKNKSDYSGLKKFFKNELYHHDGHHIFCWINCDFLVQSFNLFYNQVQETVE